MPSSATGGSSPRAAYCATPCFPAHARAERAVPASCSTMCSDGLVVFLTCVLCCTKRMHLGRWILSEETGSASRSYSCSAQLTRNSCPRPPSQQHARASANKTLSCVTTRSISFSMWATCRRQAELSSRRDCRGKASPSHFVSLLDRAIGTVLMPTKVQTRPTEGGGLSNVQRTKGGEGARPTEGGGLSNVRGTKGGGAVHKRVGHGSDARRSHLPPPLAASPHRCRPPPGSPTGQNHRQRTVCPSPRPSLPRFAATSPPPASPAEQAATSPAEQAAFFCQGRSRPIFVSVAIRWLATALRFCAPAD